MNWATRHLQLLDDRPAIVAAGLKPKQVEAKLGWLRKYSTHIHRWSEMLAVVGAVEHYVRHEGIHARAAVELDATLPKPSSLAAQQLRKQLLEFVREQGAQARDSERLLGSSEVLESLIGKFKYMAGERGLHGLTGMVLAFGACVGRHAVGTVQAALEEITNHAVWDWCRAHLGSTVQSVRQQITQALQSEQTRKPLDLKND